MKYRTLVALTALFATLAGLPSDPRAAQESPASPQTQETPEASPAGQAPAAEEFSLEPAPEQAIPEEYLQGKGYLGGFSDAWATERLFDPVNARVFLALQDGAGKEVLSKLEVPDLDLALADLMSGRMVRESGGIYRPAFPLIRGQARQTFAEMVQSAADRAYASLRPALKKIRKAARKEKAAPWLYAMVWTEVLESKTAEKVLSEAGALDPRRLRDEGYLWFLIPGDSYSTGDDRYGSGSETLHYLWTPLALLNPAMQDYPTRRRLLDTAWAGTSWDEEATRETLEGFGILDSQMHVRVPVLRKDGRLLPALREASGAYARNFLAGVDPGPLAGMLGASRDEVLAAAFACTGYRILERAVGEGFFARPDYLSRADAPMTGLVEALVIAEDEGFNPLERAYYLYDREDFNGAIQMADTFLEAHPGDPEALFRKGISLMKLRKYPEALQVFEQAATGPAAKGDVWRGWILIRQGNILDVMQKREEALRKYSEALSFADVSGSHAIARNWMENVYQD